MDRRKFLKISLAATAAAAVSPLMASPLTRLMEENNSKTNTVMTKKMILLNASPRKNKNTAQMLESVMKGAQEAGAECELIHLVNLNFKGCMSCFACKRKGNTCNGLCAYKDELRPAIILIPGREGSLGIGRDNIQRAIERAVGADIL